MNGREVVIVSAVRTPVGNYPPETYKKKNTIIFNKLSYQLKGKFFFLIHKLSATKITHTLESLT